ncbi:hypothetical protein, partial [Fusobacterium necrophorum]|uniref:hypothetical protein n=1 Tax=Fusobacterium necrophorum TaxID=859 RepID=UPI001C9B5BDD
MQKKKNHKIVFYGMICLRQPIKGENYYDSKTLYHKKIKKETLNFMGCIIFGVGGLGSSNTIF